MKNKPVTRNKWRGKKTNLQKVGEGRASDSSTVWDVGNAVVGVLGHLPSLVVETVGLADTLDAMEVDWMSHLDLILPALLQEVVKVLQLLLQFDEEQGAIFFSLKTGGDGKFGKGRDHDSTDFCPFCFPFSGNDEGPDCRPEDDEEDKDEEMEETACWGGGEDDLDLTWALSRTMSSSIDPSVLRVFSSQSFT
jgi:hypothetical protein